MELATTREAARRKASRRGWRDAASNLRRTRRGDPCGRPAAGIRARERATARVAPTRRAVQPIFFKIRPLQPLSRLRRQLPFLIETAHGAGIRIGGYGLHRGAIRRARAAIGAGETWRRSPRLRWGHPALRRFRRRAENAMAQSGGRMVSAPTGACMAGAGRAGAYLIWGPGRESNPCGNRRAAYASSRVRRATDSMWAQRGNMSTQAAFFNV